MNLDIRYAAGLFDGEGWITVCRRNFGGQYRYSKDYVGYQLFVGLGMTYKPLITAYKKKFGGSVFTKKPSVKQSDEVRYFYVWRLSSGPASEFLSALLPHMIAKKAEAVLAVELQKHITKHRNTLRYHPERREELYAHREDVISKLRELKRKEFKPPVDVDPFSAAS